MLRSAMPSLGMYPVDVKVRERSSASSSPSFSFEVDDSEVSFVEVTASRVSFFASLTEAGAVEFEIERLFIFELRASSSAGLSEDLV